MPKIQLQGVKISRIDLILNERDVNATEFSRVRRWWSAILALAAKIIHSARETHERVIGPELHGGFILIFDRR